MTLLKRGDTGVRGDCGKEEEDEEARLFGDRETGLRMGMVAEDVGGERTMVGMTTGDELAGREREKSLLSLAKLFFSSLSLRRCDFCCILLTFVVKEDEGGGCTLTAGSTGDTEVAAASLEIR